MKEVNLFKFYFAKYFLLALGLLQVVVGFLVYTQFGGTPKSQFASFVIFTLALILFSLQWLITDKIRRVALGKKKVAVIYPHKVKRYHWEDVKSIRFFAFFNMYCMKLKGKKDKIYFLSSENSESIFSLFSSEVDFVQKKVSKA